VLTKAISRWPLLPANIKAVSSTTSQTQGAWVAPAALVALPLPLPGMACSQCPWLLLVAVEEAEPVTADQAPAVSKPLAECARSWLA